MVSASVALAVRSLSAQVLSLLCWKGRLTVHCELYWLLSQHYTSVPWCLQFHPACRGIGLNVDVNWNLITGQMGICVKLCKYSYDLNFEILRMPSWQFGIVIPTYTVFLCLLCPFSSHIQNTLVHQLFGLTGSYCYCSIVVSVQCSVSVVLMMPCPLTLPSWGKSMSLWA